MDYPENPRVWNLDQSESNEDTALSVSSWSRFMLSYPIRTWVNLQVRSHIYTGIHQVLSMY